MNPAKVLFGIVILTMVWNLVVARSYPIRRMKINTTKLAKNMQGTLSTFNFHILSRNVEIIWNFTLPEDVIFTLHAKRLEFLYQLNLPCPGCCPENSVTVPNSYSYRNDFCAVNVFETVISYGTNFVITFRSQFRSQGVELEYSIRKRTAPCSRTSYQCYDKKGCYELEKICDGEYDCEDHTDEQNCGKCRTNYSMCNNEDNMPIEHINCFNPALHRCDGILQCRTGEDEFNCVDACINQIQCADGSGCYTYEERCNGVSNCKDHSDELNCHSIKCDVLSNTSNYFACKNGWCIKKFKYGDGVIDCDDKSDEIAAIIEKENNHGIMGALYVLLVFALLWIGIWQCSGTYHAIQCKKEKPVEREPLQRGTSFIYNYKKPVAKRNAASQISGPISCDDLNPGPSSSNSTGTNSCASYASIHSSTESIDSVMTVCQGYETIEPRPLKMHQYNNHSMATENMLEAIDRRQKIDHHNDISSVAKINNFETNGNNNANQVATTVLILPPPEGFELWI